MKQKKCPLRCAVHMPQVGVFHRVCPIIIAATLPLPLATCHFGQLTEFVLCATQLAKWIVRLSVPLSLPPSLALCKFRGRPQRPRVLNATSRRTSQAKRKKCEKHAPLEGQRNAGGGGGEQRTVEAYNQSV